MKQVIRKLNNTGGESLTETLVALLIMTLVMMVFAGSVVTAARINERANQMVTATHMDMAEDMIKQLHTDVPCKLTQKTGAVEIYEYAYDESTGTGSVGSTAVGSVEVTLTKEAHTNDKSNKEDSFYFYTLKN